MKVHSFLSAFETLADLARWLGGGTLPSLSRAEWCRDYTSSGSLSVPRPLVTREMTNEDGYWRIYTATLLQNYVQSSNSSADLVRVRSLETSLAE